VVTAQKRAQSAQDVPITMAVLSAEELSNVGITDVEGVSLMTPGLRIQRNGVYVSPYLRGVGTRFSDLGLESGVGIYLDDLYSARTGAAALDMVDIARVEVLKGPQGTLFGRNTAGGAIRVITNDPTDEFEGRLGLEYGRFDHLRVDAVVNVPLSDKLAARAAVSVVKADGYIKAVTPGMPDLHDRDTIQSNVKLLWTARDTTKVKFTGTFGIKDDSYGSAYINNDSGLLHAGVARGGTPSPGFYTTTQNYPNPKHTRANYAKNWSGVVEVAEDLGWGELKSISGYRVIEQELGTDLDHTDLLFQAVEVPEYDTSAFSQEFQLTSGNDSSLQWVAGLYYYREQSSMQIKIFGTSLDSAFGIPPRGNFQGPEGGIALDEHSAIDVTSFAPYAQITYTVAPAWSVILGGRYSYEKKELGHWSGFINRVAADPLLVSTIIDERDDLTFEKFSPKVGVEFRLSPQVMLYASWSEGFKSGGFTLPNPNGASPRLKPEVLNAWEIGWKTEFRQLRFNGAAFYYQHEDVQVGRTDPLTSFPVIENAAEAEMYGLEGDVVYAPTSNLELAFGGTYLHSEFSDGVIGDAVVPVISNPTQACIDAGLTGPQCGGWRLIPNQDLSGNPVPMAPDFSGHFRARYQFDRSIADGQISTNVLVSYVGKFNWNSEPGFGSEQEHYLVSGGITWESGDGKYSLGLLGQNLFDEKYRTQLQRPPNFYVPGMPRTWMVRFQREF